MRKQVFGRKLQRDTNERKALFKSLMTSLIEKESIRTTEAKAKAVRGEMEKLVTKARDGGKEAERMLQGYFSASVLAKLVKDIAPRFAGRPGGYTRIVKLGTRFGDNAKMVVLEWVEKGVEATEKGAKKVKAAVEKMEATTEVKEKSSKTKKTVQKNPAEKKEKKK
ncbi:MAG: 50S ribosomal protein L17 [Patescibacteria group bacterium]|nr:50S ribosomal protein L17 [Patescibacteria group bacterium]MDE2589102.1 50S ribosomal protein L17 [Patescibacteria group bacterium]